MSDIPGGAEIIPGGANSGDPNTGITPPVTPTLITSENAVFVQPPFKAVNSGPPLFIQGDSGPSRAVYLTDANGVPILIPDGAAITYSTFVSGSTTPTVNAQPAQILSALLSAVAYNWQTGDLSVAGSYDELWTIITLTGQRMTIRYAAAFSVSAYN